MTIERNHSRDSSSSRTIEEQQDEIRTKDPKMNGKDDSPNPQKQLLQWWSDKEDLKVRTKLDFRIMPLIFLAYGCAALDRSNIGNARNAGLTQDLNISDSQYQFLLTIFYISYTLFQWLLIMYNIVPPHLWMSINVFLWGITSILQATAFNWSCLMAARFFLGIFEAAFGTGMALYLSSFYPRREVGFRFAIYSSSSAVASAIAGALAFGLQSANTEIRPWKLIFIVEGAPTIILVPFIFFLLPDKPESCRFLTERERLIAKERRFTTDEVEEQEGGDEKKELNLQDRSDQIEEKKESNLVVKSDQVEEKRELNLMGKGSWGKMNFKEAFGAFKDPMSYISAILLFSINTSYSSIPVYLPTILKENGYTALKAQGLTAPPYVVAFVVALAVVFFSDRTGIRAPCLSVSLLISGIGYVMLATIKDQATRYGAVFIVTLGLFTSIPLSYMVLLSNSSGKHKRGFALAIFGTVGQCGPFLGTEGLYGSEDAPFYVKSTSISAGIAFFAAILSAATAVALYLANRRRDRRNPIEPSGDVGEGEKVEEIKDKRVDGLDLRGADRFEFERRLIDVSKHGEKSPYFRYVI